MGAFRMKARAIGQALSLTAGQCGGALAQDAVVALGHGHDEIVGGGLLGRGDDVLECGPLAAVGDVLGDRAAEQERLLQHHAHL